MDQHKFDEVFSRLTFRRKQVLQQLLAGERDEAIAQSLKISSETVRKHIENICREFGLKNEPGEQFSKRPELKALFSQYKPECLANNTIGTSNESEPAPAITPDPAITPKPAALDLNFIGRKPAITELNNLVRQGAKVIVIQAAGGVGKTTLAQEYLKTQGFELVIELPMAKETENITAVESVIEEWLKQDFKEEPGREFGITLGRLKRQLQTRRVGILIDNLEPALDQQGKFIEAHRRYMELLRVLADSTVQSLTLMTSRERLCESGVTVEHYQLLGLDEPAWHQFFSNRNINIDAPTLKAMHTAYGGNAKAMRIFCGAIREDFDGNMAAYWQENGADLLLKPDLKDLITSQFNRLQEICPKAYKLMCRLGCFRYQDVSVVPTDGILCLLWDVLEAQPRQIIESLRNRSLVEYCKGEYSLHPVIRAEAISRLRESEDWEEANRKAAEYWTESVKTVETIEDALRAFEAYYHYVEIDDFEQACSILIKNRNYKNTGSLLLGFSFCQLGLFQTMIFATQCVIDKVNDEQYFSILYNILAHLNSSVGNLSNAIKFHTYSGEIAKKYIQNQFQIASIFNIGFCKMELGELEEAAVYFKDALSISNNSVEFKCYAISSCFYLGFINSYLGFRERALYFSDKFAISDNNINHLITEYALLYLGLAYKNLGSSEKAMYIYHNVIFRTKKSSFSKLQALALTGMAEIYREQGDLDTALCNHSESIEVLDKIGAKCNLAEAYYQLALTYQKMGKAENSEVNFKKAIQLYTEMEAPKQVEKVRQAMVDK